MIPITVGKIGLLINSIILFLLYVLLHCCPKILIWHYVNLGSLYLINLLNVAFILMILISKSQLKTYSTKDFGYILIVFEFLSILSIMVLFFHDHKSIMKRQLFVAYSCSSSVYSDHMDKPGTANSSGHKDIMVIICPTHYPTPTTTTTVSVSSSLLLYFLHLFPHHCHIIQTINRVIQ